MKLYWNGEIIEEARARASVVNEAYLNGSALVETMQVKSGRVLHFGLHLSRFADGARALMMPVPGPAEFRAIAQRLIKANRLRQGALRCRCFSDGALLMHPLRPAPGPRAGAKGIRLLTTAVRHYGPESLQGRIKANSMLPNLLARWESQALAEDGLRLTPAGYVAEGVWTNILVEKRGVLMTPPLSDGVLDGITRAVAIAAWVKKGGKLLQAPLTRYDLYSADRAWVCSSLRGLLKIAEVDGRKLGPA